MKQRIAVEFIAVLISKFDKMAAGKYERKDFRSAQEFGSRKFQWLCKAFIIMPWERAKVAVCAASTALARDNIS